MAPAKIEIRHPVLLYTLAIDFRTATGMSYRIGAMTTVFKLTLRNLLSAHGLEWDSNMVIVVYVDSRQSLLEAVNTLIAKVLFIPEFSSFYI